MADMY
jgi:hypothetical protein